MLWRAGEKIYFQGEKNELSGDFMRIGLPSLSIRMSMRIVLKIHDQKCLAERMHFGDAVEHLRVRVRRYLKEEIY